MHSHTHTFIRAKRTGKRSHVDGHTTTPTSTSTSSSACACPYMDVLDAHKAHVRCTALVYMHANEQHVHDDAYAHIPVMPSRAERIQWVPRTQSSCSSLSTHVPMGLSCTESHAHAGTGAYAYRYAHATVPRTRPTRTYARAQTHTPGHSYTCTHTHTTACAFTPRRSHFPNNTNAPLKQPVRIFRSQVVRTRGHNTSGDDLQGIYPESCDWSSPLVHIVNGGFLTIILHVSYN
jgi:hypothetical protein